LAGITHLIAPADREGLAAALAAAVAGTGEYDLEFVVVRPDGAERRMWSRGEVLRDDAGTPISMVGTVQDITERMQAEQKLARYAARLQQLSARMVELQEGERRSIAAELHDRVGQSLSALSINLNMLSGLVDRADGEAAARIHDSRELIDGMARTVRSVISELRPAVLDDYGLLPALRWFTEQFEQRTGIAALVSGPAEAPRLAPEHEAALFRMAQEVLTNAAKHSRAHHVTVQMTLDDTGTTLVIEDDGVGFEPATLFRPGRPSGFGLLMLRERIESVGGRVRIDSQPGRGTRIVAHVSATR
jgi:signal transduction histidine kinase